MKQGKHVALGIIFGTLLGVLTDNIGLWLSLGVAIGAGLERKFKKKELEKEDQSE